MFGPAEAASRWAQYSAKAADPPATATAGASWSLESVCIFTAARPSSAAVLASVSRPVWASRERVWNRAICERASGPSCPRPAGAVHGSRRWLTCCLTALERACVSQFEAAALTDVGKRKGKKGSKKRVLSDGTGENHAVI
mmetsp:Transcript_14141/g.33412  ORF Transcript_14141/g.33412 Transcript_14141/m.33412 type:complete len:141 (-) Transcript_14141:251-673(-)